MTLFEVLGDFSHHIALGDGDHAFLLPADAAGRVRRRGAPGRGFEDQRVLAPKKDILFTRARPTLGSGHARALDLLFEILVD